MGGGLRDNSVSRAIIALDLTKEADAAHGHHQETEAVLPFLRLVLSLCGEEKVTAEDIAEAADYAGGVILARFAGSCSERAVPLDVNEYGRSTWLDGFLTGIAAAHGLWGDLDTREVDLRPEVPDDAR